MWFCWVLWYWDWTQGPTPMLGKHCTTEQHPALSTVTSKSFLRIPVSLFWRPRGRGSTCTLSVESVWNPEDNFRSHSLGAAHFFVVGFFLVCFVLAQCASLAWKSLRGLGSDDMAQWVKALAMKVWWPELDPQNPCKGGRGELIPQNCPLTSISPACACAHTHTPS